MPKKIVLFLITLSLFQTSLCYGLDWKRLYEKADNSNLSDALSIVKTKPDSINDLYVLALVYLNLHKDKEAEEVFVKVMTLDPEMIEAKWGIAEVLRRQHKLDESEELLKEVIKSNPEFSPAYINLAYIMCIRMDFNEVARLAGKVLRQREKKVDRSNRVRAYLLFGGAKGIIAYHGGLLSKIINGTNVLRSLKTAEQLQPNSLWVRYVMGTFYLLVPSLAGGDIVKAEEYLKQAIEIDPLFADPYVRLGQIYKAKGDNAKYKEYINKALEIDPQNELAIDISSGRCKFMCIGKR